MAKRRKYSPRPGASYVDLAEAVERTLAVFDGAAESERIFEHVRKSFTVDLGPWERMLERVLGQIEEDAGTRGRGLWLLGVPTPALIKAWLEGPEQGMQASTRWLAKRAPDTTPDIRLRVVKVKRGDDYADLVDAVRSFRLRGDGQLDAARLRPRYTIALRRSWLVMVGDLLGQVVADAGSCVRAATVLGVRLDRLRPWVRWFVSRGSSQAARLDWPLASVDEIDAVRPYADLAAAVMRGGLDAEYVDDEPEFLPLVALQEFYRVRLGPWEVMVGNLLEQISLDAGSRRKAAKAIKMPRSTLSAKLNRYQHKRGERHQAPGTVGDE